MGREAKGRRKEGKEVEAVEVQKTDGKSNACKTSLRRRTGLGL